MNGAPAAPAVEVFVALGGNLGDVRATFRAALALLAGDPAVELGDVSPVYRTRAMMPPDTRDADPDYWNAVVALRTELPPGDLLARLLAVERACGRQRNGRWRSRTLDLDLLLYGHVAVRAPGLEVPHPGLAERLFVLRPLCDVAPHASLPDGTPVVELLARHADPDDGILEKSNERLGAGAGLTAAVVARRSGRTPTPPRD